MTLILRRLVAFLDALSAAALLALTAIILIRAGVSVATIALSAALLLLAGLCALAAAGMWRATRLGAVLTLVVQALQLPQFETPPLTYMVNVPFAIVAGLGRDLHFHGALAWRPGLHITFDSERPFPWVGVNLIALLAVVVATRSLSARAVRSSPPVYSPPR